MKPAFEDHEKHVRAIIDAAIAAADPRRCVVEALRAQPLDPEVPLAVIAVGKAAPGMVAGLNEATDRTHETLMVVPDGVGAPEWALRSDHPLGTIRGMEAAHTVARFVERTVLAMGVAGQGMFVVLLSGGASALLCSPVHGIGLDEYRELTGALMRAGADIGELNCVRRHCEELKGGRLAAMMAPNPVRTLILSDVIGDDPAAIGSGPCCADATTYADALEVLSSRGLRGRFRGVEAHLVRGTLGEIPESIRPGDPRLITARHTIVGNNAAAVGGARRAAQGLGFAVGRVREGVTGPSADAGARLGRDAKEAAARPVCLLAGGETTVDVGTETGTGGRNLELALAAAIEIDGAPGIAVASAATDGVDGPTDAAGAMADGGTCAAARRAGLDAAAMLRRHDSFGFFERAGGLIRTGPTGTNVNDVWAALVY